MTDHTDESGEEASAADAGTADQIPKTADDDVVVVGGGFGGYAAALAAARERSAASVRLLVTNPGQFDRESGLIDVLGAVPGESKPVSDPLAAIDQLPADHRYRRLGVEAVRTAIARFDEATGDRYAGGQSDENALLPTAVGKLQPAARYPGSMANGLASTNRSARFVGFDRVPDFDSALIANRIRTVVPHEVSYSTIKTPYKADEPPVGRKIATALDDNRTNDAGTTTRESLANALRPVLDVEPRVGVPAVLGLDDAPAIRAELESLLQIELFELPLGPPSVPGARLDTVLSSALEEAGVSIERDVSVSTVETTDETVERLAVSHHERGEELSREGSAFVLATGGVTAGGIESDRSGMSEPLFDCQVSAPDATSQWVDEQFLGDHQAVRAGVTTDDELRALPAGSESVFENLYAAGRVLAGPNVVAERSAAGIALTTGDVAGHHAVEH